MTEKQWKIKLKVLQRLLYDVYKRAKELEGDTEKGGPLEEELTGSVLSAIHSLEQMFPDDPSFKTRTF